MTRLDDLKRQLAELDALITSGVLTGEAARQARDGLEAQILAAVLQPASGTGAVAGASDRSASAAAA